MNPRLDHFDADGLAARVVETMYARDQASQAFGMEVIAASEGRVTVKMLVRENMTQAVGTCHGGMIFTLADSAFAFACNTRNETTVAAGCDIEFLRPAYAGETLTAEAVERGRKGRSGVYDISISNEKNELVALFRGKCRQLGGPIIE